MLLFGVGTDFCLFLVARYREEWQSRPANNKKTITRAIASSWTHTHDAIVGSALTTSIGLLLMVFCQFEKFRNNGVIIAIAILVTLLVSLTFTPALLCAVAPYAFRNRDAVSPSVNAKINSYWMRVASFILKRPIACFSVCFVILCVPAIYGMRYGHQVTYDFLNELSSTSPSRRGMSLINEFFSTRDNSPITLIIVPPESFDSAETLNDAINSITRQLYLPGVSSVRSLSDPLGDYPPERRMGLFSQDAWRRRMLKNHRITRTVYTSQESQYVLGAARIDVLIDPNPFSTEAKQVLESIDSLLQKEIQNPQSPWAGATFAYTGTTAGIVDLQKVTQADLLRIQILVTLGVWCVLFVLLRRPWFSAYLMVTVLLSYLATLGLTHFVFSQIYAGDFMGLDWKVPLLLFVILVAVGQDYNVYLTTRVIEEQKKLGPMQGLYQAMVSTGAIITSCGVVMAATFLSMTSGAVFSWLASFEWMAAIFGDNSNRWLLRSILELGFALGVGVLIDTFLVRTVLVPSVLAILCREKRQVVG